MSTEAMTALEPGSHEGEHEVKKSRFLGYAQKAETWKEAQEYIEYIHTLHPKARHACYGFVAGVNPVTERCSDDGEPTGTAGQPILGEFSSFLQKWLNTPACEHSNLISF